MPKETKQDGELEYLYALVVLGKNGQPDALVAAPPSHPGGAPTPFLATQSEQVDGIASIGQEIADQMKRDLAVLRFDRAEVTREIPASLIEKPKLSIATK